MGFFEWLESSARRNDSLVCVGLDTQPEMPAAGETLYQFNRRIVDATRDLVCAYKPNSAFYEAAGPEGMEALRQTIEYVHATAGVPVILDAKRGDIGSTAAAYARAAFEVWGADAITVNPYLGGDAITPFTAHAGRGAFLVCHTSNPGATDLQVLPSPSRPLYEVVAGKAVAWGTGLVVGATYPEALARVRALVPDAWILLPGIGAQGGDAEAALAAGLREDGLGLVVNSSRGIIGAADPRAAAGALRDQINAVRSRERAPGYDPKTALTLALADIGAIKLGQFTLKSGQRAPIYIDLRLLASHPAVLRQAGYAYAQLLREELGIGNGSAGVRLAGIPYAALPIGTAVALETDLPLIYPRREVKAYGTGQKIEGAFRAGERAVVLDDLITTGGSKLEAIRPLEEAGLIVKDVVVLIDREQGGRAELEAAGYKLHAVLGLGEMLERLVAAGRIRPEQQQEVLRYLRGEG